MIDKNGKHYAIVEMLSQKFKIVKKEDLFVFVIIIILHTVALFSYYL